MSLKILVGLLAAVVVTGAGVVATYGNPFDTDLGPSPCSMKSSEASMPCSEGDSCCAMTTMPSCCSAEEVVLSDDANAQTYGCSNLKSDAALALVGGSMVACETAAE